MLDVIREGSKGWLAKVILALIAIPFALFGIDTYFRNAGQQAGIADVDDQVITVQEYSNALQNLNKKLQAEGKADPAILENPEVKRSVLDRLINDRLIASEVKKAKFNISDEQLSRYITSLPEFSENGQFSQALYDQVLSQNRLTASRFEAMMRDDLKAQQVKKGFSELVFMPVSVKKTALGASEQSRQVTVVDFKAKDFLSKVTVDPAEVQAYYDKNKDKFKSPEQVKIEFAMLSANNLVRSMNVPEEEVKAFYVQNSDKFQGSEQRRASHILIGFGVSPTPQTKDAAKKKAEEVLSELKKPKASFEALAKKYSQDPGSAEKGGDLGLFGRGAMVKPFEEAVYSMKPGELSGLVESEFGYHIIKLTEIQGASQSYEEVRPQIMGELLFQKALTKFSEQAEEFTNTVYEQSDSLGPVAQKFGLELQKTDWLSREDALKFFKGNQKLVDQLFSADAIKEHRNTEALEPAPNSLISARVLEHKPSAPKAFADVKLGIEELLKLEKAANLAKKQGEEVLAQLKAGKEVSGLEWIPPVTVTRKDAQGLTDITMSNVFKLPTKTLPAMSGVVDSLKGYQIIKVLSVNSSVDQNDATLAEANRELNTAYAAEYMSAYLNSLKATFKTKVNESLLNSSNLNNQ